MTAGVCEGCAPGAGAPVTPGPAVAAGTAGELPVAPPFKKLKLLLVGTGAGAGAG